MWSARYRVGSLGKFHGVDKELGSSMKSVGEVMAIGRTFEEAIQKGLRMIGQGMHGFVENKELVIADLDKALREPTDKRIFVISKAFRAGYTVDQVHELTKIDRWFLEKLMNIMDTSRELHSFMADGELPMIPVDLLRKAKVQGFSDFQIARALGLGTSNGRRRSHPCRPQFPQECRHSARSEADRYPLPPNIPHRPTIST